jgi:NADH-quinone oxidoreductase subunit M
MAPLAALIIFFGFYPKPVFDVTRASVAHLVDVHHQGVAAAEVNVRVAGIRP